MKEQDSGRGGFTGRHMLAIMVAFFGVIIAVNVTMATVARTSWSGLVVTNSYIASQQFNDKVEHARRQAELGWTAELSMDGETLRYRLTDRDGRAVAIESASAALRRPVGDRQDRTIALAGGSDGAAEGRAVIEDGVWIVDLQADAGLAEPWRDTRRVRIAGGILR